MFASKDIFLKSGVATGPYTIPRSVRLRSSASGYFNRTFSTPTSTTIWTWSAWVKRGSFTNGTTVFRLFGASTTTYLTFNNADQLNLTINNVSAATSTAVFRDPSSWYHIVYQQNGSAQTLYVNNASVATGTTAASVFNTAIAHQLGAANTSNYFDGYITEVNFVDGQALTPSSFGAISSTTGVWQPIAYTGTYGTNGFYLKFNSYATAAALGTDSSGNSNTWTVNNVSVTAGATYDSMQDVPTLTSATVANYPVMNPLVPAPSGYGAMTFSNGNLNLVSPNAAGVAGTAYALGTMSTISGKYYFEVTISAGNTAAVGIAAATYVTTSGDGGTGAGSCIYYGNNGNVYNNSSTSTAFGAAYTTSTIGVAFDVVNQRLWFAKDNTWQASGDPAAGTNFLSYGITGAVTAIVADLGGNATITAQANFGQQPFTYTPPTGFVALNAYNLPTPTIANGAAYMAATTYTGNNSTQTIANTINGVSFKPDLVWIKGRSTQVAGIYDSLRGATLELIPSAGSAETTQTTGLTAFTSTGFTVGSLAKLNGTAVSAIAWQWYTNGGSSSSNTNGTITSTVSVGATQGFSIVTYTGTGTAGTVGHGLGVVPNIVLVKSRSGATGWFMYDNSAATPQSVFLRLDSVAIQTTSASFWGSSAATSSAFGVSTSANLNTNGASYVAYCFSSVAGFSAFGRYTGNGAADGPFVYLGFRPRWLMIKRLDATSDWYMWDTARSTINVISATLLANSSAAETSAASIDDLSNGFKCRDAAIVNAAAGIYLYMAFAENPFKYSLAR
jgi:hypothetical protein